MEMGVEENMQSRTVDYTSDTAAAAAVADDQTELWHMGKPIDQSLLWKPTPPLVSSFLEAKNVYENGTGEIRRLLVRECSLIYECNACRNIFRSLTCFITHKRVYCNMTCNDIGSNHPNGFQNHTVNTNETLNVVKEDEHFNFNDLSTNSTTENEIAINNETLKDEHNQNNGMSTQKNSLTMVPLIQNIKRDDALPKEDYKQDQHKSNEVKSDTKKSNSILNGENKTQTTKVCEICKAGFATEKALKIHTHKKHFPHSYAFQCPVCSQTFGQPGAVVRHLSNEHKKSIRCIKMMRDAIYKRKVLCNRLATTEAENKERNNTKTDNASSCPYCDRRFQRKAVLATHLASCQLKTLYPDKKLTVQENTATHMKGYNKCQSSKERDVANTQTNVPFNPVTSTDEMNEELQDDTSPISKCSSVKEPLHSAVNKQKTRQKINAKFLPCLCKICNKHFNALCNLRRHISMFHYRTRKFGCKLCDYRAYRKYDVINHLGHIHKIMGEKESISLEYIETYEEQNSRDGVDDDVVLITDEKHEKPKKDETKPNITKELEPHEPDSYKNKLSKSLLISTRLQKNTRERQNLKRSISQQLYSKTDNNLSHYQKRPRRNCIKTVKKDFVYDLSNILKKDNPNDSEWKTTGHGPFKRRNTMANSINVGLNSDSTIFETKDQIQIHCKPLIDSPAECIKGAAQKTALTLINQGRAASATVPQLPTERPQVRVRHASIYKADLSTVPVFETTALEEARLKVKLLDDNFLENLSTTAKNEFKIKPRLALPQSTINSLLQKVDLTLQKQFNIKSIGVESKNFTSNDLNYEDNNSSSTEQTVLIKQEHCIDILPHANVMENHEVVFAQCESDSINIADDGKAYSNLVCLPQKPRKCIKLMECLLEDKTQNRESLLRFALEN